MPAPVPVTLITGFLGAGKSALVSHVLHAPHGKRCAVVVNEFGAGLGLGLEKALVQDSAGQSDTLVEEFIELPNGCICCTVKDSFLQTLEALLLKRDRFDYLLVETTGLADPGPVAQALWADEAVEPGAVLDAVVTVVDALHFRRQLEEPSGAEAALQVAHADVVLLNKTDLVSPAELDAVEEAVRGINATAEVLRTQRSAVDLARILGLGTLAKGGQGRRSAEACLLPAAPGASARTQEAPALAFAKGAQQLLSPVHDACISTVFLAAGGLLDEERFRCWLEGLLWEPHACAARRQGAPPPEVLRAKGVFKTEAAHPRILQAVRQTYELTDAELQGPASQPGAADNRLVLIGRGLDAARLDETFRECLLDADRD